jgi:hypothetical protein
MASRSDLMRTWMPTVVILLCLAAFVSTSGQAQQILPFQSLTHASNGQNQTASRAKIDFSETMWDFGHVPKAGKVVHTYLVKSVGEDTLIIAKVRTTCGCTSAPLSRDTLAPGETARLDVVFDPAKVMVGETTKRLHVVCNDPNNPLAEIRFRAKIGDGSSLVRITPAFVDFDTVLAGTRTSRTLIIENTSGEKLSLTRVEGPGDGVDLDLRNQTLQPGQSVQAVLQLRDGAVSGGIQTSLTLDFECSKTARVTIPIEAFIPQR